MSLSPPSWSSGRRLVYAGIYWVIGRLPRFGGKRRMPPAWVWTALAGPQTARAYFWFALAVRGCRRTVEKTPHNILHAEKLLRAFPRGTFYVYRHPADV